MKRNIGNTDKKIRVAVGAIVVLAGILTQSWWGLVGIVPLVTAVIGFCPLYPLFGFSTCETEDVRSKPGKSSSRLS